MAKNKKEQTNSSISYTGKVKIEFLHGNKVVKTLKKKNTGMMPLFSFLARCLAGDFDSNGYPRYIRLFSGDSWEHRNEVTTAAIPASSVGINLSSLSDDKAVVAFEFLIPYSMLPNGTSATMLAIYSNTNRVKRESPSAYIILGDEDEIEGDGKSNIKVTWSMMVSNAPDEE